MSSTTFEHLTKNIESIAEVSNTFNKLDKKAVEAALLETDANGFSLLHYAVDNDKGEVVQFLLGQAVVSQTLTKVLTAQDTMGGRTAFHLALDNDGTSSFAPLVTYMFKGEKLLPKVLMVRNNQKQELLNKLVEENKLDVLTLMTEKAKETQLSDAFLGFTDSNGKTVLQLASASGEAGLVDHLVKEIATTSSPETHLLASDKYQNTALHWAADANSVEVANILMTAAAAQTGALKKMHLAQDDNGNTPLNVASDDNKKADVAKAILDNLLENPEFAVEGLFSVNSGDLSFISKAIAEGKKEVLQNVIAKASAKEGLVEQILTFKNADGDDISTTANAAGNQVVTDYIQLVAKEVEEKKAEAERVAKEAAEKAEAERVAKEAAEKAEAERVAKEAAEKAEAERVAKEAAEKAEAERVAKEAAEKAEAERVAKEAAEKAEAERVAKEAAEKAEAERVAKEAAEKAEAERVAKEAAEKAEADRVAKEAAEKAEAERVAKEAAEAKAKSLTSPELKKFAKALFDAKHHQEIKADGAKLLSITDKEEMIKAVTAFQVTSKKISGLGGDGETEICHVRDSEFSNYCYFPGEKNTKSDKYVSLVNKWVVKFTENGVNKPDAQMKQDVAIAQQIALKAGCEAESLTPCMQSIVNYYCTLNDGTLAHDTLCTGFSIDSLIA